ncbi:hypothetical protein T492DRAFT_239022 [Pavlovales sp. CCMP2436]|nr:hypothetical protein T492DRAFT_239022 [Pavlovales sp. CCMP2436]
MSASLIALALLAASAAVRVSVPARRGSAASRVRLSAVSDEVAAAAAGLAALARDSGLPIFDVLDAARAELARPGIRNLLLEAPPGAGKTTTVPLAVLLEAATTWRTSGIDALPNILVVEPRRVAARAAAARIASTLGQEPGGIIGYAIRGETKCDRKRTRVTVLTDGVLLNKLREVMMTNHT